MAQLLVYSENDFPPEIECQAVSFVRVQWSFVFSGEDRLNQHMWRGWNPAHFVIEEAGVLISYATVIETTVEHAGEAYRTMGVSSVFTYPSFRREGYGRRVVEELTSYIQDSEADIAILWCEPELENFYSKCGWVATRSNTLVGTKENPRVADDPDYPNTRMMLFVSARGKAAHAAFEAEPLFVGAHTW